MIQTRWGHINRGYSLLTRVQAMFLDGHLLLEQVARSRSGRFFNFNGTAGLWRKSCILESGGWQHDTLTEDLDLSYRAQLGGWQFVFLNDVVTPAELPVDMNGFKSQQHRWTKGSIQTCKKLLPRIWRSASALADQVRGDRPSDLEFCLSCSSPVSASSCIHPPAVRSPVGCASSSSTFRFFSPLRVSVAVFYICAQRELHPRTWMKEILLLPALIALGVGLSINNARAVLEAVFNHQSEFKRTPKYGIESKSQNWRSCRYMPLKSLLPIVEIGFAIYFSYFVCYAFSPRPVFYLAVPCDVSSRIFLRRLLARSRNGWPRFNSAPLARSCISCVTKCASFVNYAADDFPPRRFSLRFVRCDGCRSGWPPPRPVFRRASLSVSAIRN